MGGRFLKKDKTGRNLLDNSGGDSGGGGKWYDVGNKKARLKTLQALREGASELRSNNDDDDDGDDDDSSSS